MQFTFLIKFTVLNQCLTILLCLNAGYLCEGPHGIAMLTTSLTWNNAVLAMDLSAGQRRAGC